ncbi:MULTISPECIES: sulfur carrier protein ThiS [unclassified Thiomonas]|jgi:sulfur carrier protein|uniref:sulfur carrier protein ThiS n=1 Tax=unclassified Thiomonas TaxID=2625466 RepID=UPI0004DBA3FB|nr:MULTISPECIES: sulfur carrier protein ThiS [unclassified Thiomonas]MDD4999631.1 sulfur carrier protein ThiS [Thiomonas arsenitoxydans]CQR41930.1 Thiamine biosynthesis protein ThiS [Thiomonas sp. CB3]CDW95440.1 Thiamine biosynthesis protein ThiS [Thiomonas sp. CB2]VDY03584.1 Thiamine biosynthesis protein ThiS [Thiomonas sp. Bio17B3]VDY09240.1 Thiamine biosynthesis protein ThiS [Thiomonas sp. Sup16B3]
MNTPTNLQISSGLSLQINGEPVQTSSATLADLLTERGYDATQALACAVNRHFVPRTLWAQQILQPGDAIEVVSPVVGG